MELNTIANGLKEAGKITEDDTSRIENELTDSMRELQVHFQSGNLRSMAAAANQVLVELKALGTYVNRDGFAFTEEGSASDELEKAIS